MMRVVTELASRATTHLSPGHAGCDEWVERVESDRQFVNGEYPECFRSAQLAAEWMEHYYDRPVNYGVSC